MKRFAFVIISLFFCLCSSAQTFEVPFLFQPDTLVKNLLPFQDAGAAGRDMTWNFRSLSAGEDYPVYILQPNTSDSAKFHTIEHRTRYYWRISGDSLYSGGFENANAYMPYKRPELSVKRLMTYGDTVHSVFSGTGEYGHRLPLFVEGVADVAVDAYGTLILPDDTIRNVFRVHTIRRYWEIFSDTTNLETHLWQWYSPDYRYPVFESMRTVRVNPLNSLSDTIVYSASFMLSPSEQEKDVINVRRRVNISFSEDESIFREVKSAPNPVVDNLHVECVLLRDASVSVQIFSATGIKIYHNVFDLSAGHNSLLIPMSTQISGAYTLLVSADGVIFEKLFIKQ